ncbi:MAG: energy transducer TonB, partial [Comamonadaceae bacterium]|nr:energy transducer TonB [Comamonadaceae bacterium]
MSHALPSAPPSRRLAGLATIIGLHVGAFYLLANGLSRESVQAVLNPVQTRLIQEVKAPPPPPPPPRRDI